jgi:hypothetical protein
LREGLGDSVVVSLVIALEMGWKGGAGARLVKM